MTFNDEVGECIRDERIAADVTQESLAEAVGLSRTSIVNIEGGKQSCTLENLVLISEALDCPLMALVPLAEKNEVPALRNRVRHLERIVEGVRTALKID